MPFGALDSTPFSVDINSRTFGGSVDYAPDARWSFSGGYTHMRLTTDAAYRVNNDGGQGSRVTNDAGGVFIRSLPFVFQNPEARLSFKLGRRLDWNVGYQYYAYREKPPFNTGQDYRAHLPYTSLRLYFGARE